MYNYETLRPLDSAFFRESAEIKCATLFANFSVRPGFVTSAQISAFQGAFAEKDSFQTL
jgi:hypothetical protein